MRCRKRASDHPERAFADAVNLVRPHPCRGHPDDDAAGAEFGKTFVGLHHIGFEVDDVEDATKKVVASGAVARHDINEALGLDTTVHVKGELKFSGPDGVLFDLSEPGIWQVG